MKRVIVFLVTFFVSSICYAEISWSGDVDPLYGIIGETGNGMLNITAGGEVSNGSGTIGYYSGSMGAVTVEGASSKWTIGNDLHEGTIIVGFLGDGTLNITGGGAVSNEQVAHIATKPDSTGSVTVDGAGSTWTNSGHLGVGIGGDGTLNITGGGVVSNQRADIGAISSGTGKITVDGAGSTWTNSADLYVGYNGKGELNITDGGLVSVAGTLTIDLNGDDDSFINMDTGGMLALAGDGGDSLVEFLGLVDGTDAIRYWNGSSWADIIAATNGLNYTLEYISEGDLAGYTMLTVPEPATFVLLGLGGMLLRRKK